MKNKLSISNILLFFLLPLTQFGQDFLGYSNSNYSGVSGISLQPACIVDDRMEFDLTLFGFNVNAYNNYIGLKKDAIKPFKGPDPNGVNTWFPKLAIKDADSIYLTEKNNNKNKAVYSSLRVNMPSFMLYCNHKNSLAFTWDVRNYLNVDGLTPDLAKLAYNEFNIPSLWNKKLEAKDFSVQQMAWAEYGITYGRVLKEDNEHYFKSAVRLKFLQGIFSTYMHIRDFKYEFTNDTTLSLFQSEVSYGHSRNFEVDNQNQIKLKTFESYPGIGGDLGIVYEWRPDYKKYKYDMDGEKDLWRRDQNKYKLRVGFSLLDVGAIKFKKGQLSNNFVADVGLWNLNVFDTIKTVTEFDSILKNEFEYKNAKATYSMNLPTAISFQVDYNIYKDFYVNMTPFFAFQFKKNDTKVHDFSSISITPRWDHKWFGVFLPVQYHALDGFRMGATVRLGPVIFGTTNLTPLISKKDIYGLDLHAIVKVPIPFGPPKDKDKDGISNKKDKCIDAPGTWEFMGCPDKDGDHIADSDDKCPEIPGLKEMNGCPDKDGDKITDAEDACPDVAGIPELKGCPDKDGDKITDKEDDCPDIPGIAAFKGCPDRDNDSIPDKDDKCPDLAGPKEYNGCPDKDGDLVLDNEDACPDVPGAKENKGCPYPDTDKDGVYDKDDACVNEAGPSENKGCPWPDSDKDGTLDKDDNCVTVPGPADNKGCPVIKEEEKKIIEQAFGNLEFASGTDKIKSTSFQSLNDLAKLLKEHAKDWTLQLSGHTDNQGTEASNLALSKKRAEAVKKFLVGKGVKADKIVAEWFGQTKPIESNDTEAGRQKNRRVEMKIIFK